MSVCCSKDSDDEAWSVNWPWAPLWVGVPGVVSMRLVVASACCSKDSDDKAWSVDWAPLWVGVTGVGSMAACRVHCPPSGLSVSDDT